MRLFKACLRATKRGAIHCDGAAEADVDAGKDAEMADAVLHDDLGAARLDGKVGHLIMANGDCWIELVHYKLGTMQQVDAPLQDR